jgi:hypothetical protein
MTAETDLSAAAHKAVTDFVNAQKCASVEDVKQALGALLGMTMHAIDLVTNGKSEKLS